MASLKTHLITQIQVHMAVRKVPQDAIVQETKGLRRLSVDQLKAVLREENLYCISCGQMESEGPCGTCKRCAMCCECGTFDEED